MNKLHVLLVGLCCGLGFHSDSPKSEGQITGRSESASLLTPPSRASLQAPILSSRLTDQPFAGETAKPQSGEAVQRAGAPTTSRNGDNDAGQVSHAADPRRSQAPAARGEGPIRRSTGFLRDVAFATPDIAIAVGGQGLIWRSIDGGKNWSPCESPTDADLVSVVFDGPKQGWAVGGKTLPVKGVHQGVVLTTTDGGINWRQVKTALLPRLVDVKVTDSHRLYAVGLANKQFPERLYESLDGGHSWNPLSYQPLGKPKARNTRAVTEQVSGSAWYDGENCIYSSAQGTLVGNLERSVWAEFAGEEYVELKDVEKVGQQFFSLDSRGRIWISADGGRRWIPGESMIPRTQISAEDSFDKLEVRDRRAWFLSRESGKLLSCEVDSNRWQTFQIPTSLEMESFSFSNAKQGCCVGPLGNVLRTEDGGATWNWEFGLHKRLGVLIVAGAPEDVPTLLLTQLAANNCLNVGVLLAQDDSPHVFGSVANDLQVAWWHADASAFDVQSNDDRRQAIKGYLEGLQPQILLVCPGRMGPSVATADWISVAQDLRHSHLQDPRNQWGIMGQTVMIQPGESDASISAQAYAPTLQRELRDATYACELVTQVWRDEKPSGRSQQTVGIQVLASAGISDLSWFGGMASTQANGYYQQLSRRLAVSRPDPLFNLSQQISRKNSWLDGFASATANTPELRAEWARNLVGSLPHLPGDCQQLWLMQLAEECERLGDSRKACLAWWEAWKTDNNSEVALVALQHGVQLLISDEVQWASRNEAQTRAEVEMLAAEKRMQTALANGLTSEEAMLDEALLRWGIDPAQKEQVPGEVLQKIKALEEARIAEQTNGMSEPKTLLKIPDFQTQTQIATPTTQQFGDKNGNKVVRNSTVVSWANSTGGGSVAPAGHIESQAPSQLNLTLVDRTEGERCRFAYQQMKLAEGTFPYAQGVREWWRCKAHLAEAMDDVRQWEFAWGKVRQFANGEPDEQYWKDVADYELSLHPLASRESRAMQAKHELATVWAEQRPRLDGQLNDPLWADQLGPETLGKLSTQPLTFWGNDEQYLYVTILVKEEQPEGTTPDSSPGKWQRDRARQGESLSLRIDTDRDYGQAFELYFDRSVRDGGSG